MAHLVEREHRRFLGDFDTREEAQARLDELLGLARAVEISLLGQPHQKCWPCKSNSVRLGSAPRAPDAGLPRNVGFDERADVVRVQLDQRRHGVRLARLVELDVGCLPFARTFQSDPVPARRAKDEPAVAPAGCRVVLLDGELQSRLPAYLSGGVDVRDTDLPR
jgi:hypothetical protein